MGLLRLGVFYLQERLAVGGSADVWRGVHPGSSLAVAVKLLREPIDRQAVGREARAVASLLHPAVVRIVTRARCGSAQGPQAPRGVVTSSVIGPSITRLCDLSAVATRDGGSGSRLWSCGGARGSIPVIGPTRKGA